MNNKPIMPNESVEERVQDLCDAVSEQNNDSVLGSIHVFMMQSGDSVLVEIIPEERLTNENKIRLIHAMADWARKND